MRPLLTFFLCWFSMTIVKANAAIPADSTAKDKLIALLQNGDWHCLSCSRIYQTFHQADSLARLISTNEKDELFTNADPSVRYYAFLNVLATDEEKAFGQ